ncbi:MAG TPA: PTS sugar transporter subunit IIA [Spirochaetia bacterium]|nr:PTS sugar transporter subunit IIA [Spirochaetia bacterium]
MDLYRFLSPERFHIIKSRTKEEALREMVGVASDGIPDLDVQQLFDAIWHREEIISSWLTTGIAIPHARLKGLGDTLLAVGLSREGIEYDSSDGLPVHMLILILGDDRNPDEHIYLLSEIARLIRGEDLRTQLLAAPSKESLYQTLRHAALDRGKPPEVNKQKMSRMILTHALSIAREIGAKAVLIHSHDIGEIASLSDDFDKSTILVITQNRSTGPEQRQNFGGVIHVPFTGSNRYSQIELSLLFAVSQGRLNIGDRVVGVLGAPGSGFMDTLMVIDVGVEFSPLFQNQPASSLGDVQPQILERVLQIAMVLSREGREGRQVGTIFVIGDHEKVSSLCQQLVINPFRGYEDAEKSILDPILEETIKEFATIDGAFIIRGDGVILSAGTFLRAGKVTAELPSGLGARHAAASGITAVTAAISVAISQSTGSVSVFKSGKRILTLEKPKK